MSFVLEAGDAMGSRDRELEVTIRRGMRREDRFVVTADPKNSGELREVLEGWLEGNNWGEGLWGEFEMDAREADDGPRVRLKVRA